MNLPDVRNKTGRYPPNSIGVIVFRAETFAVRKGVFQRKGNYGSTDSNRATNRNAAARRARDRGSPESALVTGTLGVAPGAGRGGRGSLLFVAQNQGDARNGSSRGRHRKREKRRGKNPGGRGPRQERQNRRLLQ